MPETADRVVERPGEQQPLVAIRQAKPAATQRDAGFEPTRQPPRVVEPQVKVSGTGAVLRRRQEGSDRDRPAGRQPSIGMEEEQPCAGCRPATCRELSAASRRLGEKPRPERERTL